MHDIPLFSAQKCSTAIALNDLIQYSHCLVVELFRLKSLLIKAPTTLITKYRLS